MTEAIMDATVSLAAEVGLKELSLDDVATRAGVARSTIYRRWPSKDALLKEAVEMLVEKYKIEPNTGSVREDLLTYARTAIVFVQGPLRPVLSVFYAMQELELDPDLLKRTRESVAAIVKRGIDRGELRSDLDPEFVIELIFAMIWYQVTTRHRRLEASYAETVVDVVLRSCWQANQGATV